MLFEVCLPRWCSDEEAACNAADTGLIPGSGRSPGEGNGNPLQYSCLGNPKDRGDSWAIVHGVTKSRDMTEHTAQPGMLAPSSTDRYTVGAQRDVSAF